MFSVGTLLSWVAMPVVRYALIAVAGLLFTAYMRHSAAAPWKNQVHELREAIASKERIIKDHEALVEASEVEAEKIKVQIESIADAARNNPGACVLTSAQLDGLRKLASGS